MATGTWSASNAYTTDALFRAAAQRIHDAFSSAGWVQTSDTGQINLSTVTRSILSFRGYEMWKMADALQSTTPVFLKIEYGNDNDGTNFVLMLRINIGFATDGAGVITGTQRTAAISTQVGSASSALTLNSYWSGSTNRFILVDQIDHSTAAWSKIVSVERTKDASGNDTSDGIVYAVHGNSVMVFGVLYATGGVPQTESRLLGLVTNTATSVYGSTVYAARVVPLAGQPLYPIKNMLVAKTQDFSNFSQYSLTVDGGSINYLVLNGNIIAVGGANSVSSNARVLMRYD